MAMINSNRRTARGAKTLPGHYYTSDEIYQREGERIFSQKWLYTGRISQLADPGSYFLFDMDRESVIILKDEAGQIRAFHNVCRHRGTRLCSKNNGRFSHSIQCPYHAWTYALNGELLGAPNMQEVSQFVAADYPLHPVNLATWEGCIFVNLSPTSEPFETAFAPVMGKFTKWRLDELQVARRLHYDIKANWKLVLQNYSECYHCPNLHPQLNRLTPYRDSMNDLEEGPILGGPMKLTANFESMTMSGKACAAPLPGIAGTDLKRVYYYVFFPNMLLSLHPDYVLMHRITRQAPDQTHIVCDWLYHPEAIAKPGFDPTDAVEFWNSTNQQDWQVCELSQQGIASQAYTPGPYSELESMIAALDREYFKALGEME